MGKLYVNIILNFTLPTCMETINNIAGTLMRGGNQEMDRPRTGRKQTQTGVIQNIKRSKI
jgi:hypothetical protein